MFCFKRLALVFAFALAGTSAFGQIGQLVDEAAFDPNRVKLNFNAQQIGANPMDLYAAYGLRITGIGGGAPVLGGGLAAGQPFGFVSNEAPIGEGIRSEVVLDFQYPIRQLGVFLKNGAPGVIARFKFLNVKGENLGVIQFPADNPVGPFAGFEAPAGEAFSRVIFNYGDSPNAEQFVELIFTYLNRPLFRTYIAQIADGALPGGGLRTNLLIANLANTTNTGSLELFGDDGKPLEVVLNETRASSFPLNLPPAGLATFASGGTAFPPVQGYACITSAHPVTGLGVFQVLNAAGNPASEAGVGSAPPSLRSISGVVRSAQGAIDSGIAVANVGSGPSTGSIQLIRPNGQMIGINNTFLNLGPGQHTAGFLPNIFPGVDPNLAATLVIVSDQPLSVVVLRTADGLVLSSLPVGTLEQ